MTASPKNCYHRRWLEWTITMLKNSYPTYCSGDHCPSSWRFGTYFVKSEWLQREFVIFGCRVTFSRPTAFLVPGIYSLSSRNQCSSRRPVDVPSPGIIWTLNYRLSYIGLGMAYISEILVSELWNVNRNILRLPRTILLATAPYFLFHPWGSGRWHHIKIHGVSLTSPRLHEFFQRPLDKRVYLERDGNSPKFPRSLETLSLPCWELGTLNPIVQDLSYSPKRSWRIKSPWMNELSLPRSTFWIRSQWNATLVHWYSL